MALLDKTKRGLDWLQHGYLVFQLLSSGAVGTAVKAILVGYTHVPPVWITPLELLASALMMALLVFVGNRLRRREGQPATLPQHAGSLVTTPANFDATLFFRGAYYSPLQPEIETNVRAAAAQNEPTDREAFYTKLIAVGLIAYTYDTIWFAIYGSQLSALLELNRKNGLLPLAEFKTYYDNAVAAHPAAYANYSFDEWLTFMKAHVLILTHPSEMVEITVRGKDFLKVLLHWGRDANQRAL